MSREPFDPRYIFSAVRRDGDCVETHSHFDAIVFAADDPALPEALKVYLAERIKLGDIRTGEINELKKRIHRLSADRGLAALEHSARPTRTRRKKP